MFRMFFIISPVSVTWYILPKRKPDGKGRNPMIVTINNPAENNLLIFAGSWKISAINSRVKGQGNSGASVRNLSIRRSIYASFPVIIKKD
jgi:hypothetical protein